MNNTTFLKTSNRKRHGFTMVELMISFAILTMMGIAFMTLYTNVIVLSGRTTTTAFVAMDAAKAVDRISMVLREARRFEFMDNGTSGPAAYQTPNSPGNNLNYSATISGTAGGATIVTGLRIVQPARLTGVSLSIPASGGYATSAMIGSNALVDYRTDGGYLDVYRSDRQGHPAPTTGTCLWMRGSINGVTISTDPQADTTKGIDGRPMVDDIAPWAGSVQFLQGQTNEVRIKIVTGQYYQGRKQVTSDSSTGKVTGVAAVDVYLRNHDPSGVQANSVHGKTQYTGQ